MVIPPKTRGGAAGWMMAELAIAASLIVLVMIPIGYTFHREHKLSRTLYHRAVMMQVVDGETEFLKAGEWKNLKPGENEISTSAEAAKNLRPGKLIAIRGEGFVRVEWRGEKGAPYKREFAIDEKPAAK